MTIGYCEIEPYTPKEVYDFCEATKFEETSQGGHTAFVTDSVTIMREGQVFSTRGTYDKHSDLWTFIDDNDDYMQVAQDSTSCGSWN